MAYGIETGGGVGGGLARGLSEGAGLAGNIINSERENQARQQELGLRQQGIALQGREADRLDQQSRLQLHQAQVQAYDQQLTSLGAMRAKAYADGNTTEVNLLDQHIQDAQQGRQNSFKSVIGGEVYDNGKQALSDANALNSGQATPQQLGPMRYSNVFALTGHPAIDYVDHPDHPGGTSPIGAAVDQTHQAMENSNHGQAVDSAYPLLQPHVSGYEPGHDLHQPGIASPYPDPDGDHPHIGKALDIVGAKATLQTAAASDPASVQLLHDAHAQGATDQQKNALQFVHAIGGPQQLKQFSKNSSDEQKLADQVKAGADPAVAAQNIASQSLEDRMDKMRQSYLEAGLPIPEDLKMPEKEKAVRALIAANPKMSRADATAAVYTPEIVSERMRSATSYGVEAQRAAAEEKVAGIRLQGVTSRGLSGTIAEIDQQVADGTITPEAGAQLKRDAVGSAAHRYDKPKPGDKGAVTDIELHREATRQAEDVYKAAIAKDPDAKVDIGQITQKLYSDAKAARDQPPAAAAPAAPAAAAPPTLPPAAVAALKDGQVTTFKNGTKWTLQGGKPVQVQ